MCTSTTRLPSLSAEYKVMKGRLAIQYMSFFEKNGTYILHLTSVRCSSTSRALKSIHSSYQIAQAGSKI